MKITKYGLREKSTGKILGFHESSNEGRDFCNNTKVELNNHSDKMWLVDSDINAEYVRNFPTEWYNASHETPKHSFEADELEVVKIIIEQIEEKVDVKIPTVEELFKEMYEKSEPEHYKLIKQDLKRYKNIQYTWYDLKELLRNRK